MDSYIHLNLVRDLEEKGQSEVNSSMWERRIAMNKEELGQLYPITIVKYDLNWPSLFEKEKQNILKNLSQTIALRVEHIGSTAVPHIAAKPTIDILVEIPSGNKMKDLIINKLCKCDYIHMEEQKEHLMFVT